MDFIGKLNKKAQQLSALNIVVDEADERHFLIKTTLTTCGGCC